MSGSEPVRILYMEDDAALARLTQRKLGQFGYSVDLACDGEEGLAMYAAGAYDLVAVDHQMPGHSGLEVIRTLAAQGQLPPTIMITGAGSEETAVEAMRLGVGDYVIKDVEGGYLDLLPTVIERVLEQRKLAEEKRRAEEALQKAHAELKRRTKEHTAELTVLLEAARAISSTTSLKNLLTLIAQQMVRAVGASGCTISRLDQGPDEVVTWIEWREASGPPDEPGTAYALDDFPATRSVLERREPLSILVSDPDADPAEVELMRQVGSASLLMLPLAAGDQVIGVVEIDESKRERRFTAAEIHLCQALADQAAVAIQKAWLYEQAQQEIAERVRGEQALRESEERFRAVFETAEDSIFIKDRSLRYTHVNPAMERLFGVSASELIGRTDVDLFGQEAGEHISEVDSRVLGGEIVKEEDTKPVKGIPHTFHVVKVPMRDSSGEIAGLCGIAREITERVQIEEALREARDELEMRVEERTAELAMANEQLRLGLAELERAQERLQGRERFLRLLNDITRAALETPDLQAMLQILADQLGGLFDADGCVICLCDQARQTTIGAAAGGDTMDLCSGLQSSADEPTMVERVLRHGRPLVAGDLLDHPEVSPSIPEALAARSVLGLPLVAGAQELGAAFVLFNDPHEFAPEEVERGEHVAGQVALAIAKASLLETEREQRKLAETLREVGSALSSTLDREQVLRLILEQLGQVVAYDSASVMLVSGAELETVARRSLDPQALPGAASPEVAALPHVQRTLQRNLPVVIPDTARDPDWLQLPGTEQIRCWLGVPLVARDQAVGLLNLNKKEAHSYSERDAQVAAIFAAQAAMAIENAQLFAETQSRFQEMTALYGISLDITGRLEMSGLLQSIVQRGSELLNADSGGVYLYDEERDELRLAVGHGDAARHVGGTLRPGEGIAGRVLQTGEPIVADDYREWDAKPAWLQDSDLSRAVLEVPLRWEERVVGVLFIDADCRERTFGPEDVRVAKLLASQAAVALENARLYKELQQRMDELSQTQVQLIQSTRMATVGELATGLAHEINNPLTGIVGMAQILGREASTPEHKEGLESIVEQALRAADVVRGLQVFVDEPGVRTRADVNQLLRDTVRLVRERALRSGVQIVEHLAPDPLWLVASPLQVRQLFLGLITRALLVMPDGGELVLSTRIKDVEGQSTIEIRITDSGPPTPPDEVASLFEIVFDAGAPRPGLRLGLAASRTIAQDHGGDIAVECRPGQGTTFAVQLPRAARGTRETC